jgi:CheY-like chemotaxis protein
MAEDKKTILVMDDDLVYLTIRTENLVDSNFVVIQASNPQEALEKLRANPHIDLLLTDREVDKDGSAGFKLGRVIS